MKIERWFYAYGALRDWVVYALVSLLVGLVLWGASVGIYTLAVNSARDQCRAYSEATLRDTKYVKTAFLSWECFVRVDGQWVLKQQVWTNGKGN
jgi:hypothetical protein